MLKGAGTISACGSGKKNDPAGGCRKFAVEKKRKKEIQSKLEIKVTPS